MVHLKRTSVLISVLLSVSSVAQAQDADRLDRIEKRIGNVETKLDALIGLLTQKSEGSFLPTSPEPSAPDTAAQEEPSGELQQGVNLDVYSMSLGNNDKLPGLPSGTPAASATIPAKLPFNLGDFQKIDGVSQYANPSGKTIGQLYWGNVMFRESGEYVFQATLAKSLGSGSSYACTTSVIVDDTLVISTTARVDTYEQRSSSENGAVSLQGGMHKVAIWATCDRAGYSDSYAVSVSVKSPKDRAPKPLDANRFFVEG